MPSLLANIKLTIIIISTSVAFPEGFVVIFYPSRSCEFVWWLAETHFRLENVRAGATSGMSEHTARNLWDPKLSATMVWWESAESLNILTWCRKPALKNITNTKYRDIKL